jgi:hypothetical protein
MRTTTCPQCCIEFKNRTAQHVYCSCACREAARRGRRSAGGNAMEVRAWAGTSIQRRRSDGYVNATAMCKANGKRWENYHRNERTEAYIAALAPVVGIPATGSPGLIQTIKGGTPELQGTWVHPRIAVDLARWIAPAFAVWMDGWFLESLRGVTAKASEPEPATGRRPPVPTQAVDPRQITWGDRETLLGLAWHARQIDSTVRAILRSGQMTSGAEHDQEEVDLVERVAGMLEPLAALGLTAQGTRLVANS